MIEDKDSSKAVYFTELNILHKELNRSLDVLGKPANLIRRLFIRGLTKERLARIDKVIDTVNSMIKKIIGAHPGTRGNLELISDHSSWELTSIANTHSSWQSRISTISINTINMLNSKKQQKQAKYFKDYIYEFVNDQKFNELSTNAIEDYLLEECIDVLHDAVLYFAISSRNNEQQASEDRENILKIVTIINSLFHHNLSVAQTIESSLNEEGPNNAEKIKEWLQYNLFIDNLLEEENKLRSSITLSECSYQEEIKREEIIDYANRLILSLINFKFISQEKLLRQELSNAENMSSFDLSSNFNATCMLFQQQNLQRMYIQQESVENWHNILTKFNEEKTAIYIKATTSSTPKLSSQKLRKTFF